MILPPLHKAGIWLVDYEVNDKIVIGIGQLKMQNLLVQILSLMLFHCIFPAEFADIFWSDEHLLCIQETLVWCQVAEENFFQSYKTIILYPKTSRQHAGNNWVPPSD